MKKVSLLPMLRPAPSRDVIRLSCVSQLHLDPAPMARLFANCDLHEAEALLTRMMEDIAARLLAMQSARAVHDFDAIVRPTRRVQTLADQLGLIEVAVAARHVGQCVEQKDAVGLDATFARLERGFDMAMVEVWGLPKD